MVSLICPMCWEAQLDPFPGPKASLAPPHSQVHSLGSRISVPGGRKWKPPKAWAWKLPMFSIGQIHRSSPRCQGEGTWTPPWEAGQRISCHLNLPRGVSLSISHIFLPSLSCFSVPCDSLTLGHWSASRLSSAARPLRVASRIGLFGWGQSQPGSVLLLAWETPLQSSPCHPRLPQAKVLQDPRCLLCTSPLRTPTLYFGLTSFYLGGSRAWGDCGRLKTVRSLGGELLRRKWGGAGRDA